MSELRLFLPIGKVDEARRLVYGTLTEETKDKSGEVFDYASGKPAVQAWSDEIKLASKGKSLGNVRAMHGNTAAGKFTDIVYDDANKRIEGAAKIVDDDEWAKVLEGVYTGFSIGGAYTKRWQDPENPSLWRFTPKLSEISLVDNPCVPTATFEYIKADGSVEMRKFITPSHKEDSMTTANSGGAAAADNSQPAADAGVTLAKTETVKDGKAVKPKSAPLQKWMADDGSAFDSKREAEVHNLHLEKQAELAPGLDAMNALLKGKKKPVDEDEDEDGDDEDTKKAKKERREKKAKEKAEKDEAEMAAKADEAGDPDVKSGESKDGQQATNPGGQKAAADALGKKDYSDKEREEMADKGEALEDGSFPIKTKKDLKNAVESYGRAKDKDKAKAHIIARAKDLGAEEMLPEDWKPGEKKEKSVPKGKLAKGLHQVGWLAHMLDELTRFQDSVEIEQYFEDDKDSELPAKLKSIVSEFCELLVTLVEEETAELSEGDDTDVEVMEMAAGLPAGHPEAIAKAARAKAEPLSKSDSKKESEFGAQLVKFAEALEKAGARHSKADTDRVQKLHDHAEEMHKCMGDMVEKCAKMHKMAGESKNTAIDLGAEGEHVDDEPNEPQGSGSGAAKMSKLLDLIAAEKMEKSALTGLITKMNTTLEEASDRFGVLQATNAELVKRMEHLEKQPLPSKGHVRAVSKAQDGSTGDGNAHAEFDKAFEKMTPAEKANALMKAALSNPMTRI